MAGDPACLPVLLGLGINELSMNPQSIPMLKNMIRALDVGACRKFVETLLVQKTADTVNQMVQDQYGSIISETSYPT